MATSDFTSDTSAWSRPHTPPYTPRRPKRPLSHASSAASLNSAVQATETTSPPVKTAKRANPDDGVTVEELTDGDTGYIADSEIVYPQEFEEVDTTSEISASEDEAQRDSDEATDGEPDSGEGIVDKMLRLDCDDEDPIAGFEKKRKEKRDRKRTNSRIFKRPHSLTVNVEVDVTDSEALPDHDHPESARRLRRRTRGPDDPLYEFRYVEGDTAPMFAPITPTPEGQKPGNHELHEVENDRNAARPAGNDVMEVDDYD